VSTTPESTLADSATPQPCPPLRAEGGFPVVGIIGGGQLARMSQPPAVALSLTLSVLAESETASAALVVPHSPVGDHTDLEAVRAFAAQCDVVTFDHEHVPAEVLRALEADGVPLHPAPGALRHAQDKLVMRQRLTELGIPCPRWTAARTSADVEAFGEEVGWPFVAKTPRGGYDGKGVLLVRSPEELEDWLARVGQPGALEDGILLEEAVDFTRELAALVARSPSGQATTWPVVETVQTGGVCTEVLAPAPDLDPDLATEVGEAALRIAGELGVTGVMAVELFEVRDPATGDPAYLVNELAMRPHNSGHWTIDGAVTSQFEQHLRAVLDLPLGDPSARQPWTVMANVLGGEHPDLYPAYRHLLARDPRLRVHLYGKGVRPGRKLGHVTVYGGAEELGALRERARHAADYLQGVIDE
jgi:5-(carboxyamino)imidazole ribonucleotide synthase